MNTVLQITPNYAYNMNMRSNSQNINFKGSLGDKFVKEIINDVDVKPADLIREMKGTFGIKTDKAEDILESFIAKVKQLYSDKRGLKSELQKSNEKINAFPKEKENAVSEGQRQVREYFQGVVRSKDSELSAKDAQLKEMKSQLEKYQQVVKVKSVEEVGTIMPDRAVELMEELIKNKVSARKSMAEFLLTGKGQEEALRQIERNNMIMKAHSDGITQIPEVEAKMKEMQKSGMYFSRDSYFTTTFIEKALKGSPKGSYIKSKVIKDQIKANAMAILSPMADERYSNTGVKAIEQELDKSLANVEKYHDGLSKGIEKIKGRIGKDYEAVDFNPVEFSPESSKVVITDETGTIWTEDYNWVANYGNSSW